MLIRSIGSYTVYLLKRQSCHYVQNCNFWKFISLYERKTRVGFSLLFILMKQIHRCLTIIIFTRLLNQDRRFIISLYYVRKIYLAVATTRSHFNLYETQFCSSTKGVISFKLMVRKKFRKRGAFFLPDNTWKCRL